jgi:Fe2+ transport system protein FeoA
MKDPIKFTDIESQGITIFFGIILIAMTIWLNSVAGLLWASIFATMGIFGIFLRGWRRSVNASTNNSKTNKAVPINENIGKEEIAIINALKNIISPDDALATGDISKTISLDIPTTKYFLNRLRSLGIVTGPYIIGVGRYYLLTEKGFQLYYKMNKTSIVLRKQSASKLINIDDFDTIENPGVAIHKNSKEIFCLKCLLQKNKKSPLIIDHSKGYMCRNCEDVIFHLDNWQEFIKFSKEWRVKTT